MAQLLVGKLTEMVMLVVKRMTMRVMIGVVMRRVKRVISGEGSDDGNGIEIGKGELS